MRFGNPSFFWMLWLIPVVVVFYIWAIHRKNELINRFVAPELKARLLKGFSPLRQKWKAFFLILVLFFSILSLVRPKWGFHWQEVKRKGVDIIVALDVSKSMLAQDVSPNRIERAKREIIDLIDILQGDRLGLVAFAGTSFLQSPLTLDYGAVRIFLDDLDTNLIPVPGTGIADAIKKSIKAFNPGEEKSSVLILITDGEDHEGDPVEASKKAAKQGVKIYTIGIGDSKDGAPIPDENGGFKKDSNGDLVLTSLDEETLQKIALETGGSYVKSVSGDLDLENIYKDITLKVEDKELKSGKRKRFEERFQWPLIIALLFLLLEIFFKERVKTIMSIVVLSFLVNATPGYAFLGNSKRKKAEKHYDDGKYQKAAEQFLSEQIDNPSSEDLKYNLGNSYYKAKNYKEALKLFTETASSTNVLLSQKSFYNLGNTAYRMGKLQESIKYYEMALKLNPKDKDTKFNLKFVRKELKKRIEENKKRQKKQQENKKKQCDNPNKQQQGQKKKEDQQQKKQGDKKDKKNDDKKDKQQQQKQDQKQDQKQAKPMKQKKGDKKKKISKQEAMRWLRNLDENRKKHLQKKLQGQGRYNVEKDW